MLKQEPIAVTTVFALKTGCVCVTKDFEVLIAALNAPVEPQRRVLYMEMKMLLVTFSQLFDNK
jgi:hypothetical protein